MCGRQNPEELDDCQYCQARLKPLLASEMGRAEERPGTKRLELHEEDSLDWLRSLRSNQAQPGTPSSNPFIDDPASDGALSGAAEPGEIPDWLEAIRRRSAEDGLLGKPGLGVPDMSRRAPLSAPPEDPGWLEDFRTAQETAGLEPLAPLEPLPGSEPETPTLPDLSGLPTDWISQLTAPPQRSETHPLWNPDEQFSPDFNATFHSEELPDWLKDISDAANHPTDADDGPRDMSAELSMLMGMGPGQPAGEQPAQEPPILATPEDELPDWVREFRAQRGTAGPPPPTEVSSRGLETAKLVWPEDEAEGAPAAPPRKPQLPPSGNEEVPDWLSTLEERSNLQINTDFPAVERPPSSGSPLRSPDETGEQVALPDWLGDVHPGEDFAETSIGPTGAADENAEEEPLAPAELPSWIQAMRPIETVAALPTAPSAEEEAHVEMSGPLAGLQGTLTVEPNAMPVIRPPVYSPLMQVTDRQRLHSELLEELLISEAKPQVIPEEPLISSQRILRILIAAALLIAILVPTVSGIQILPVPTAAAQEVLDVRRSVATLPAGAPVLLAVDYTPAMTGEMEAAGAGLVDDLMARGAHLTFISTSPSGPALANHLVAKVLKTPQSYQAAYASGEKTVYLGYLAGGASGLAGFAQQPQSAAPFTLDGRYAWEQPALSGVQSVNGFARIIVMTDSLETGRGWIEQLQPALSNGGQAGSLLLVTSAQSAPLLRPYVESGQAQGMIAGLAGGASYEQIAGRAGPGLAYWNGFQGGLWASILIIAGGALAYGILALVKSNKEKSEAAA